jgi:D-tyrosyl-tRNA(Tyr) deacylase
MRIVLQRVSNASVTVDRERISGIGIGLLLLVGVAADDREENADWLAEKIAGLRVFNDPDGKMNLSLRDVEGEVLAVSQFTLLADTRKGKRRRSSTISVRGSAQPADGPCRRAASGP